MSAVSGRPGKAARGHRKDARELSIIGLSMTALACCAEENVEAGSAALRVDWPVYPRRAEHNTSPREGIEDGPRLRLPRAPRSSPRIGLNPPRWDRLGSPYAEGDKSRPSPTVGTPSGASLPASAIRPLDRRGLKVAPPRCRPVVAVAVLCGAMAAGTGAYAVALKRPAAVRASPRAQGRQQAQRR